VIKKMVPLSLGIVLCTVFVLFGVADTVQAQDREGRWEFTLGTFYQLGSDVDVKNGSPINTDGGFGLELGGGYNFSDMLAVSFGMQWAGIDYDTTVFDDEGNQGRLSGTYDSFTMSANVVLNLADGPWVPYIGGGVGWTWIDTNVPNGPPEFGCWWDPWWGYVCWGGYPTKTTDSFSYQVFLGLRYQFANDRTFMRLGYTSQWMDFSGADGTPRFDVISLDFGWMF